ncbi:MAG: Bug family tripartite tricarboxylate transporter substrate binding protein [Rhodospirillaceae bacterium]
MRTGSVAAARANVCARLLLATLAACAHLPVLAAGPAYPVRPVRIIVPYSPGGSSDAVARVLGQKLGDMLGQQFVIDNRPGAAGSLGREIAAKANADGYTLLVGDSPHTINVHVLRHVPYDPIKDFTPITLLATAPQAFVVHPSFPARSVKEFVAVAQSQPGKLNYGSGGSGSITFLTGELFKLATHVNIVHVPYKSIALASADVMGGQVHAAFPTAPGIVTHARAGRLRALAVTGMTRAGALPDVPTFEESGVAGMNVTNWFGAFGPAGLPNDVVGKLHRSMVAAMQSSDVRTKLNNLSLDVATSTPQDFLAHLKSELERWGKVVKAAGIKPE